MKIIYSFDLKKESPEIFLDLPFTEIDDMFLSIANREKRNGKALYQQKHILGFQDTPQRAKELSGLNISIPGHFKQNFAIDNVFQVKNRYLVLGVGDLTANLFRPSFDSSKEPSLFFLKDEPIEHKGYYGLIVQHENKNATVRIANICFRNGTPLENNKKIENLKWLFCSTPLIYKGHMVGSTEMAVNDYDLRHTFGKANKKIADALYRALRESNLKFVKQVEENKALILTQGSEVEWYHAGIGIKENRIIVIHNIGSLWELALKFKELGVNDAVLLDSGGSSVIWANWNIGGTIAHYVNHRPNRGALIIIEIK